MTHWSWNHAKVLDVIVAAAVAPHYFIHSDRWWWFWWWQWLNGGGFGVMQSVNTMGRDEVHEPFMKQKGFVQTKDYFWLCKNNKSLLTHFFLAFFKTQLQLVVGQILVVNCRLMKIIVLHVRDDFLNCMSEMQVKTHLVAPGFFISWK